jgi:transposase InsO family protein
MKYEAIEKYSSIFEVRKMCQVLGLKSQNYYRWKKQRIRNDTKRRKELEDIKRIEKAFIESDRIYGYRMIQKQLEKDGYKISEYRIRRIMRENGLYPETQRKYKPTHNGKVNGMYSKNIVNQNFRTKQRKEVWVGDITYIKTVIGWVYLAVVIDLYNREVIGYAISKKIDTELVKQALSNAIASQGTKEGLIFHSDRGCQYSSKGYRKMLEDNGIISSMSRPGCPYDNSCAESFFATIKKERIYRRSYDTIEDVKKDLFQYIELFYNRKRMHSVLGYMSPVAYRIKYDRNEVA